jgi:hypothetical protein
MKRNKALEIIVELLGYIIAVVLVGWGVTQIVKLG